MNKQSLRKTWAIVSLLAVLGLSLGAVDAAWGRGGWGCMNANLTPGPGLESPRPELNF